MMVNIENQSTTTADKLSENICKIAVQFYKDIVIYKEYMEVLLGFRRPRKQGEKIFIFKEIIGLENA
jgi:hypothetical protein